MFRFILLSSCLLLSSLAQAESAKTGLPKWEVGVGLGALWLPHYPGADQSHSFIAPFPLLIYRGDTIRAERGGIRGILYEGGNLGVDVSVRGSLPVNSEDNDARQGMEDLDPTIELGPQLTYLAYSQGKNLVKARLPLRAVISVGDNGVNYQGKIANPNLRWDHQASANFRFTMRLAARFGDGKWHDYFYAVSAADALASRPQYDAPGGYSGSSISSTMTYRLDDWRFSAGLGWESLSGVAFEDSPLVRDNESYFIGVAVNKVLWKSQRSTRTRVDSDS